MNKFDATFLDELDSFVFLCDKKGAIHFANRCFLKKFGKVSNIREIKHLFSVDICVLDDSDILQYSPVESALLSKEQYFAVVDFEESYRQFRKVILKVLNAEDDKKLFIISYADDLSTIKEELNELKTQANLYKFMKKEAENQTIKASLLNRVSASIRDTIDKNEIIEKSIEETIYTLGASSARFYEKHFTGIKCGKYLVSKCCGEQFKAAAKIMSLPMCFCLWFNCFKSDKSWLRRY